MKFKLKILFKNGVERKFTIVTDKKEMAKMISTIDKVYRGETLGTMQVGLSFINISEIACIDIENVEETIKESESNIIVSL